MSSFFFTCFHSLSPVVIRCHLSSLTITCCHLLSLAVIHPHFPSPLSFALIHRHFSHPTYFSLLVTLHLFFVFPCSALVQMAAVLPNARHKTFRPRRYGRETTNCKLSLREFSRQEARRRSRHSLPAELQDQNPRDGSALSPVHVT